MSLTLDSIKEFINLKAYHPNRELCLTDENSYFYRTDRRRIASMLHVCTWFIEDGDVLSSIIPIILRIRYSKVFIKRDIRSTIERVVNKYFPIEAYDVTKYKRLIANQEKTRSLLSLEETAPMLIVAEGIVLTPLAGRKKITRNT